MKKSRETCSLFEEMLMWTSYRYCIGRHTYVTTMAPEMAHHYFNRLSDERLEFTATDIRREIMDHLHFLPCNFHISRMYNNDEYNPIDVLMRFIEKENINSLDELVGYANIEYDSHNDEYLFEKKVPTIKSYFSVSDIEELLPWENLASCFDKKNHKIITVEYDGKKETHRCFKSWVRKLVPCEDKPGYVHTLEFGWEPVWVDVDKYVKLGNGYQGYINIEYITNIEDVNEKVSVS